MDAEEMLAKIPNPHEGDPEWDRVLNGALGRYVGRLGEELKAASAGDHEFQSEANRFQDLKRRLKPAVRYHDPTGAPSRDSDASSYPQWRRGTLSDLAPAMTAGRLGEAMLPPTAKSFDVQRKTREFSAALRELRRREARATVAYRKRYPHSRNPPLYLNYDEFRAGRKEIEGIMAKRLGPEI
jgi:hypothetical protein